MKPQAAKPSPNILELREISKTFANVTALNSVNLSVRKGTIHALIGKNGAGKSTLTKIIAGVHSPTTGEIYFEGRERLFHTPVVAQASGISALFQELTLLPELSVAESIFLGHEPEQSVLRLIDWKKIYEDTRQYLQRVGFDISPESRVGDLSPSDAWTHPAGAFPAARSSYRTRDFARTGPDKIRYVRRC